MDAIQFITDYEGKKISAVVPYRHWQTMNARYIKLQNKLSVLLGIQEGITEILSAKQNALELQTLSDFLDECNH
ncbi:MAG: hypothetical protein LBS16_04275 [Prevotellaceae bacterium]|jgi:hypothetical protein|nr:hypothetical protein [Prevotellaceae bacterium]